MSPQHRNALIIALNKTIEGLSQIAQALEADGWDQIEDDYALSGPRPVAAARVDESSLQTEQDTQAEPQAKSETPKPAREYTLEEVRAVLVELSQQGLTSQVRQIVLDAGATSLSEVAPDKYAQIMAAVEELEHA